ncbi:MAG: bifunctional adenosylcobinamide kinase/adenosylcobinamide-phosphate guanylyltransferase [Gaiellaceae bacterium]
MSLTFLLGGARSGKSARATELASRWNGPVSFIATGEPGDEEMAERIRLHRAERSGDWETIEEPLQLEAALSRIPSEHAVVVDCLSLWVANLLERGDDDMVSAASDRAAAVARARSSPTIVVSNEVGLGVVPPSRLGRRYRDVLGRVNAHWAAVADEAAFVVAGRALPLR